MTDHEGLIDHNPSRLNASINCEVSFQPIEICRLEKGLSLTDQVLTGVAPLLSQPHPKHMAIPFRGRIPGHLLRHPRGFWDRINFKTESPGLDAQIVLG